MGAFGEPGLFIRRQVFDIDYDDSESDCDDDDGDDSDYDIQVVHTTSLQKE